jgi:hypothetical protein
MSKHTLEQVLEHLINKEDDRASELLHQFFVAKGKQIYEELSQFDEEVEEDLDEGIGGNPAQDFEEEITDQQADLEDERLFAEDEEEDPMAAPMGDEPTEPEATADLAIGGDEGEEAPEGEGKAEELIASVEDSLAELKALFAELSGGEAPADAEAGDIGGDVSGEEQTEESFAALGENVALQNVAAPGNTDAAANKKSPVSNGAKISGNGASAIKINDGSTKGGEAGSTGGQLKGNAVMKGNVVANPDAKNVGTAPGNKKAPSLQSVATPKMTSDTASNKTSPVAKS